MPLDKSRREHRWIRVNRRITCVRARPLLGNERFHGACPTSIVTIFFGWPDSAPAPAREFVERHGLSLHPPLPMSAHAFGLSATIGRAINDAPLASLISSLRH